VYDELGGPQGSIASPAIANAFLDTILDQWFATVVKRHCRGYCEIIRYADDTIAVFEMEEGVRRFMRALPHRLGKFGLLLNPAKTQFLAGGKRQAWRTLKRKQRMATFDFRGFTHYWGWSRHGLVRLKRETAKRRLRRALVAINGWLRTERNARALLAVWPDLTRKLRGHYQYFGVTDNSLARFRFTHAVHCRVFKWLNRRNQRRSFTWEHFCRYRARSPLPQPGRLVSLNPVWGRTP
jgi:RNA-directed DNA polymerase